MLLGLYLENEVAFETDAILSPHVQYRNYVTCIIFSVSCDSLLSSSSSKVCEWLFLGDWNRVDHISVKENKRKLLQMMLELLTMEYQTDLVQFFSCLHLQHMDSAQNVHFTQNGQGCIPCTSCLINSVQIAVTGNLINSSAHLVQSYVLTNLPSEALSG